MADNVDGDGPTTPDEVTLVPEPAPTRGRRNRALALWGVLTVLVLGVGALVVTSADDDPPKLPVALGAGGDGRAEGTAAPASADMAMLAYVHYVAGDDLPLLGDDGPAYKLSGDVDEGRVRDLAEALGVDGEPTERDGVWVVDGADRGHLEVYPGSGASWWYSPEDPNVSVGGGVAGSSGSAGISEEEAKRLEEQGIANGDTSTTLAVPPVPADCPPDAPEVDCGFIEPEPITPPADLPSEDEAREIALELFRDAGLDVDDAKVTVEGPYEAWYVNVEPRVDGRTVSGLGYSASIGSKGEITSAGGALGTPERLGDYPVLDTRAAIDRLNEQMGVGYGGGRELAMDTPAIATDDPACAAAASTTMQVDPDVPTTKPADGPDTAVASDDVVIDPMPVCEPPVPSEPVEIVLHEAEEILVLVGAFDESGDAYLVPGYRMTGDDDAVAEVPAVDDESLLPQPEPVEPVPGDDPVTTFPAEDRSAAIDPGPDGAVPEICLDPNSSPPAEPTEAPTP